MDSTVKKLLEKKIQDTIKVDVLGEEIFLSMDDIEDLKISTDDIVQLMHNNYTKNVQKITFIINGFKVTSKKCSQRCIRIPDTIPHPPAVRKEAKVTQYIFKAEDPVARLGELSQTKPINWVSISKYKKIWDHVDFLCVYFNSIRWTYTFRSFDGDFPTPLLRVLAREEAYVDFWYKLDDYNAQKKPNKVKPALARAVVDIMDTSEFAQGNWSLPGKCFKIQADLKKILGERSVSYLTVMNKFWKFPLGFAAKVDQAEIDLGKWLYQEGFRPYDGECYPEWDQHIKP